MVNESYSNSKFFQLEAIDSDKKLTGQCMIPDKYSPESSSAVNIMVQSCNPANEEDGNLVIGKVIFSGQNGQSKILERQVQS